MLLTHIAANNFHFYITIISVAIRKMLEAFGRSSEEENSQLYVDSFPLPDNVAWPAEFLQLFLFLFQISSFIFCSNYLSHDCSRQAMDKVDLLAVGLL